MVNLQCCRICKSINLINVISLGEQKNTSIFPKYNNIHMVESYQINLLLCKECGLIQLENTTPPDSIYKSGNYGYKSSISNTMKLHLKKYNEEINSKINLTNNDIVLDIGSNDATFLKFYEQKLRRIGIDPTGTQFKSYYEQIELLEDYFTKDNFLNKFGDVKCKVVSSICMFYDLPDPVQFAKDIYDILDEDGIWTCEQSYLLTMLKTNSIDTICHEHLEYYALTQIKEIADRANFKIIDIVFNSSNGGSFRIYFSKKNSSKHTECNDLIKSILDEEQKYDIKNPNIYNQFVNNCNKELDKLKDFLKFLKNNNQSAYLLGSSTKGNCVLQYCNITEDIVPYAVERNPDKIGCCTSTGIEIISEETMRKNPPEYLIVLPWHFKNEIIKREEEYLNNGGQIIFYFPNFEIISHKPKTLITGCDGFISNYVKNEFRDHSLYGITQSKKTIEKNITKIFFNMKDHQQLENIINIINPDNIIHLAGISSSIKAFENPFETLEVNGMITAKLCDIVFRNNRNIKLFNASSSEIYKDHIEYYVRDYDDNEIDNTKHSHPYSIAKIMGQNIVQFYRKSHKLHFSNGIIFTTQGKKKSNKFLLNKIVQHIKQWKTGDKSPIIVSDLSSYRNIIHPADVASAIKTIFNVDNGDDYCICGYNSHLVFSLVEELYYREGIEIIRGEEPNTYYEKITNLPILIINEQNNGLDKHKINIKGYPCKLRGLEWKIRYSIKDILNELLD